jgi:ketosteroid isomerase-like protein
MNQRWDAAFNRGDAAALAALYDEHAAVLPAGGDAALGASQIEALFAGAIEQGIRNHRIELHAVEGDERVATQRGRWSAESTSADGTVQHFRRSPDAGLPSSARRQLARAHPHLELNAT